MAKKISNLSVSDKIEVNVNSDYQSRFGNKIIFVVADKNHAGYPNNSVTLITEKIIQLMCFDAKEPKNTTNKYIKAYGNSRYSYSNILQWLNSSAAAGAWYTAQHTYDAPPTNANVQGNWNEYNALAGFLTMLDVDFVSSLLDTTYTSSYYNGTSGDYSSVETIISKFFLASLSEVNADSDNEGTALSLFANDSSFLMAYPTAETISNSEYTTNISTTTAHTWWLRTPYTIRADYVRTITSSGDYSTQSAYEGPNGLRPLCNISGDTYVSNTVNSDGYYTLAENSYNVTLNNVTYKNVQNITYQGQPVSTLIKNGVVIWQKGGE